MRTNKSLIIILGPTGVGKTSISLKLAEYYKTEIISCDSRQFYKELLIGAAPPKKKELEKVSHHFIHHLSVSENYNVGKYEKDGINKIKELFLKHDRLIMVGGSGLYINAICDGFDNIPKITNEIRNKVINLYKDNGIDFLKKEIQNKDEPYSKKVDMDNPQRLMRALEVIYTTGKPYSSFLVKKKKKRDFRTLKIGLHKEREKLYERINKRVDLMIKDGLIEEVKSLTQYKHHNALQTVGYKELFEYLDKKTTKEEAINKIKQNTRRLAKRQITWFKQDKSIQYFPSKDINEIIKFIG